MRMKGAYQDQTAGKIVLSTAIRGKVRGDVQSENCEGDAELIAATLGSKGREKETQKWPSCRNTIGVGGERDAKLIEGLGETFGG